MLPYVAMLWEKVIDIAAASLPMVNRSIANSAGTSLQSRENPNARVMCLQADPAYLDDEHELKDRQMLSML